MHTKNTAIFVYQCLAAEIYVTNRLPLMNYCSWFGAAYQYRMQALLVVIQAKYISKWVSTLSAMPPRLQLLNIA